MENDPQPIDLTNSQVKFSANFDSEILRKPSEYLNTNFQSVYMAREVKIEDLDYDTHITTDHFNFSEYYSRLKANEVALSINTHMLVKSSFRANPRVFIFSCILLLIAVVCGSSVGVFYFYIQPQGQLLKASWRMLFLAICISPMALVEYFKDRERFLYSKEVLWRKEAWEKLIIASAGHALWTIALVIAVNHTSMAQANLLINLHPVVIVLYKMINKADVVKMEIVGTILVSIGAILVISDGNIGSASGFVDLNTVGYWTRNAFGNIIAILGSIGGAVYFARNRELKDEYPFFLGILAMSFLGFIMISMLSVITEGAYLSFNSELGLLGFLSGRWFGIYILTIAVTGFGTYLGYIVSSRYFQPLLLAIVPSTEPIFATLLVVILGWQSFPGIITTLALIIIVPGTICIIIGNREVEERELDILDQSLPLIQQLAIPEMNTSKSAPFMMKHRRTSSAVPTTSWEK